MHYSSLLLNVHFRYPWPDRKPPRLPEKDDLRFVAAKKFRVAADKVLSRAQTTHSVPVDYRNNGTLVSANDQPCL